MTQDKPYILVIEDDKSYGNVFKRKLNHEGFETEWAPNGKAGIEKIEDKTPDLIILDLMMPKLDGFGVLEELKDKDLLGEIKIIVATNLSQEADIDKVKNAGADDYFVKSNLSISEMVEKVKEVLEE